MFPGPALFSVCRFVGHGIFRHLGILCVLGVVSWATPARVFANAGVFAGSGYDIELIKSDDVRMLSEEITIVPGRGREPFDGGLPGMDRVSFACMFVLQNLRDAPVTVQVGFPIDSEYYERIRPRVEGTTEFEESVEHYHFVAHDGQGAYPLRYVPGDKKKKFRNLFVWDMTFAANETKTLRVSYQIPISMAAGATYWYPGRKWPNIDYPGWQEALSDCLVEWFSYVTSTGASWAGGVIEKAKFSIQLGPFERYVATRPIWGENEKTKQHFREKRPTMTPAVVRVMTPSSSEWRPGKDGWITREIRDFRPGDESNIHVVYYIVFFPQTAEEVERFVERLGKLDKRKPENNFGGSSDRVTADFDALRDIFREFNGERTENAAIEKFVSEQRWHGVEPLKKIPDEVFQELERLRQKALAAAASVASE